MLSRLKIIRNNYLYFTAIFILFGCGSTYQVEGVPPPDGPSVIVEVTSSTLKNRNIFLADGEVYFYFYHIDNTLLGSVVLTARNSKMIVRLPTEINLKIRVGSERTLFGPILGSLPPIDTHCLGEGIFKFESEKRYRVTFDFDPNYYDTSVSTCAGAMEIINNSGSLASKMPLKISISRGYIKPQDIL